MADEAEDQGPVDPAQPSTGTSDEPLTGQTQDADGGDQGDGADGEAGTSDEPAAEQTGSSKWTEAGAAAVERAHRRRRERRTGLIVLASVVAVAVGAGAWRWFPATLDDEPDRTAAETAFLFLEAQERGDCDLLVDLITEPSWSREGEWSREEFLDQCSDALVGYRHDDGDVSVEAIDEDPDRYVDGWDGVDDATVSRADQTGDGRLRRDGGEWLVELDPETLILGRTPRDAVQAYVDAYNEGDCEAMVTFLAEATWSQDGEVTEDEFLDRCAEVVGPRASTDDAGRPRPLLVTVHELELDRDDADLATAEVTVNREDVRGFAQVTDALVLVREGLAWKVGGVASETAEADDAPVPGTTGAPVPTFEWVELQDKLVTEVPSPTGCWSFTDTPAQNPDAPGDLPLRGVVREFSCGNATVRLFAYEDDEEAQATAESIVADHVDGDVPTRADMEAAFPTRGASFASTPGDYGPAQAASLPGVDGALALRTLCRPGGECSGAAAYAVKDGVLVSVGMVTARPDLADLAALLDAQLERL